jgi:predicted dehydrogenase
VLRLGVVGTARILPSHLWGLRRLLEAGLVDVRVTALVGRTMEGALSFRRRGEGPAPRPPVMEGSDPLAAPHVYVSDVHPDVLPDCFTDLDAMLERGNVDAVLLLTPVHLHHTQALRCMEAGLHVLVEKPLAVSVRAGWRMVHEAARRGLTLGVAEGMRYERSGRLQRWAVEAGLLGRVEMMLMGGIGGPWSPDRMAARTPWRHRKLEAGAGPALDLGVHQFAHARYVGGEVDEVSAVTARFAAERVNRDEAGHVLERVAVDVEDTYHALFRLRAGGIGHLAFSWGGHGEPTWWPEGPIWYGERGVLKGLRLVADDGERLDLLDLARRQLPAARWQAWFPADITDSKALQLLDFVRAAQAAGQPESSGTEGLRELACAFAIVESDRARAAVAVDDVLTGRIDAYQREIDQAYGLV